MTTAGVQPANRLYNHLQPCEAKVIAVAKSKARYAARKVDWRKSLGLHPAFPLCRHPAGYWAKKVRGKVHYFGKIADDPKGQAALLEWDRVKEALLAGRAPRPKVEGVTVGELCDRFMQACDA